MILVKDEETAAKLLAHPEAADDAEGVEITVAPPVVYEVAS